MNIGFLKYFIRLLLAAGVSVFFVVVTSFGWNFFLRPRQAMADAGSTAQGLKETVQYLSGEVGVRNRAHFDALEKAAQYIERSFREAGLPAESWDYEVQGQRFSNIVAKYRTNDSQDYILVGAHYDSCFNPGADDNASGVAGVLSLARSLKRERLGSNVLFVAFTNEEPPFFQTSDMGSRVFVLAAKERKITVRSAVILEMIGFYSDRLFSQKYLPLMGPFYSNRGDFIAVVGDFKSRGLVDVVARALQKRNMTGTAAIVAPGGMPGISFSDHASFWAAGIPAVMVTDTAYLRNPYYHRQTDTADKLDFLRMADVVEGLKGAIVRLSGKP